MSNNAKELKKLADRIIELRTKRKMTAEKLAWHSKIAKSTLSSIEKGISDPKYTTLKKIAKTLRVSLKTLLNF